MTILAAHPTTCGRQLNGGDLVCTCAPGHDYGHVYEAAYVADRHDKSEEVACRD